MAPPRAWDTDPCQEAVLADRSAVLRVLGGPGTGKTTLAARIVAERVATGEITPDACLVLAPTRRAADRVRDLVTTQVSGTHSGPLARTPHSFAFGVLRRQAAQRGEPLPRLISGPEQDVILRELLMGYAAEPALSPTWPEALGEALATRTFRGELRDLLMRAVELGLDVDGLQSLGHRHGRPEWVAAAQVLEDYDRVTALGSPGALDPAWLLGSVATALASDAGLAQSVRADLRLVIVDDAQELTPAGADLVRSLCVEGVDLVLLGDPDVATQTFRGAEPHLMTSGWQGATELTLDRGHRLPEKVHEAAARVVGHIGTGAGVAQRHSSADDRGGDVAVHVFRTTAQEATWVADHLRRRHLVDGIPWHRMAVIVRSAAGSATISRVLRGAGVPVDLVARIPVRDHPAVRPFLTVAGALLRADGPDSVHVGVDEAVDLMGSPLGGADSVALRRLRRSLRRQELASGGGRPSGELLAAALVDPELVLPLGPEAGGLRRVHRVITAGRRCLSGGSTDVEELLWALWQASGLAEPWQRAALAGDPGGRRADDALDAMLALFDAAAQFTERLPGAAPRAFLDHLLAQDLAADTLAARAVAGEAVALLTSAEASGPEWDVVCVVGVQEGVWPDPRLRGALLGAADLVDAARGRPVDRVTARAGVIHDETRLFHVALTRARHEVAVTAVRSEDLQPSPYLDVVAPRSQPSEPRIPTEGGRTLSLAGLVGELRQALVGADPAERAGAANSLATLVRAGVPGADPANWWPLVEVSDTRARRAPGQEVRISPSRLDRFAKCQLQWFLAGSGGQGPSMGASQVGSLVHEIAHDLEDTTAPAYAAEVRARWGRLGLPDNWLSRKSLAEAVAMTGALAGHIAQSRAQGWERVGTEVDVDVKVGTARIIGRVDRVERDALGRVRIVDLKTGSSKPSVAEVERHPQLGAYQVAVDAGGFGPGVASAGAALLQLGKAAKSTTDLQVQRALRDDPDPRWATDLIARDAEAMAGASFLATPSRSMCGTCQVRSSCPAQAEGRSLS